MNPTQRSLRKLRSDGWTVATVERWNFHARVRQDLFGFADLLAIKEEETLAVQATSGAHVAARLDKVMANPTAALWLQAPNRHIAIHGWRKAGARGQRKTWQCREILLAGGQKRRRW